MSLRRIKSHVVPLVFAARFVRYRHECGKEPRMVFLFFPCVPQNHGMLVERIGDDEGWKKKWMLKKKRQEEYL